MEIKYYEIKYKWNASDEAIMGIAIMQKENNLEVLVGNEIDLEKHGCILDSDFNLRVNEYSIYFKIDEKRLKKICEVNERYRAYENYLHANNLERLQTD